MENNSISIGGNFEGSMMQESKIEGDLSVAINKLPASPDSEQPEFKEFLERLKTAIEAESSLDKESKLEALEQVKALAKAGENSHDVGMNKLAKKSITMLKGIFTGLQSGTTLLVEWNKLLPALSKLFGIG